MRNSDVAGGNHAWAIAAIVAYAVLAVGAYGWAGHSGDIAALLRGGAMNVSAD